MPKQLFAWVMGEMAGEHIVLYIKRQGLGFAPTPNYLEILKAAGAPDLVLAALPRARKSGAELNSQLASDVVFQKLIGAAKALREKQYAAAEQALSVAINLEPSNPDLHYALANLFRKAEEWQKAFRQYSETLHLGPDLADAHEGLAYCYYRVQDGDDAEAEARIVLRLLPDDFETHKFLGLALEAKGDLDGALKEYRVSVHWKPHYTTYCDMGNVFTYQKNFDAAIAAYKESVRMNPINVDCVYNLGHAYSDKGDLENSILTYRVAKKLAPDRLNIRQNLGGALCNAKRYAETITEYRELLAMEPSWNMARGCLGQALWSTGKEEERWLF